MCNNYYNNFFVQFFVILHNKSNDKFIMYVYTGDLPIDNSATLIVKDYCKGKSTNYLLDNHDYLIAKLTKEEYVKIFFE